MRMRTNLGASALLIASLGCRDAAESPTEPAAGGPQPGVAAAAALTFRQVSAGGSHTCGITTEDRAYCWGWTHQGQLGIGTRWGPEDCESPDFDASCSTRPVAVVGDLRFRTLSAGTSHTCGITTDDKAYCWGANWTGELGDGTTTDRLKPTPVSAGPRFRQIEAGYRHTCGVTTDDQVYCWGWNRSGQLGDGTRIDRPAPARVSGARSFRSVSAGIEHTCGVTTASQVYCWGSNQYGQIGDSTQVARRLRPSKLAGGRTYRQVSAGGEFTCGVSFANRAFCWGWNGMGQLGTGDTTRSYWPRRVLRNLYFDRVTAGGRHTCGETTLNRVYCWGANISGQLGTGTATGLETCASGLDCSTRPVAVTGGLFFAQVSAGQQHVCGRTAAGLGYCWGANESGELGIGSWSGYDYPTPLAVKGPL